ncbi:MAG: hypothetical protein Q9M23_05675 [Mariprofundaceae bacterium]|nr:hypothetical protein [Mariprofundaceae bacterium]
MHKFNSMVAGLALLGLLVVCSASASAGESRHVNFAAFEKGSPDFEYEAIVLGKFADFIHAMNGAQVLLISHTADTIDGDVINIQQDVLREDKGTLGDFGINCQLSFVDESTPQNTSYAIGGLCKIIQVGGDKNIRLSALIPMASLPDTAQGVDAWVELYEDETTGIAFYANVSGTH